MGISSFLKVVHGGFCPSPVAASSKEETDKLLQTLRTPVTHSTLLRESFLYDQTALLIEGLRAIGKLLIAGFHPFFSSPGFRISAVPPD